jgi:aminoglycoside phosphotransferase (APT) family kinase protein
MTATPPWEILQALRRVGLLSTAAQADQEPPGERMTGGVSSDIWRVDLPTGPICVKRALAKLRVDADWRAPVERNIYEARWMQVARQAAPTAVPALLGQDEAAGMLAMTYLPPQHYTLWKTLLRDGIADPGFAASVAATTACIHAATAADPSVAEAFPTDAIFLDIRLEPYLIATGRAHPDLADRLDRLVAVTLANKRALVHGDVSPKNILRGPDGPVFLDAECAWWGDPAFDLAFCVNHLLLKCLWVPDARAAFMACFRAMATNYLQRVTWEDAATLEARAASLLPGLLLARVDGKSPVEYITTEPARNVVRRVARSLLLDPPERLTDIALAWENELSRDATPPWRQRPASAQGLAAEQQPIREQYLASGWEQSLGWPQGGAADGPSSGEQRTEK